MKQKTSIKNVLYSSPMIIIMILTLLLLTYVGLGEAKRKYTVFQLQKLATQTEIVGNILDTYLNAGFPLNQFSGFQSISDNLMLSDRSIENIHIVDTHQESIFLKNRENLPEADYMAVLQSRSYSPFPVKELRDPAITVTASSNSFRVSQALKNRFGTVGYIYLEVQKADLISFLTNEYKIVFYSGFGLSLLFILLVIAYEMNYGVKRHRQRFLQSFYIFSFLALSVVIAITVFKVYEQGTKASTKALSDSMTRRLASILELNIDIKDIKGLEEAFQQYQATNPDINAIAITENGITISHSDPQMIGKPYQKPDDSLEYINTLTGVRDKSTRHFRVAVSMPTNVITKAVLDSSKAFIVLFIACSLISLTFLNAGSAILKTLSKESSQVHYKMRILQMIKDICEDGIITEDEKVRLAKKVEIVGDKITPEEQVALGELQRKIDAGALIERQSIDLGYDVGLNLIKPAYFLIVFVNALSLSFLPQLVSGFAERSLSSFATASLPFTIFYLMFALVLVPAGQYAENGDLKKLMSGGFLAEVIGLFLVALADNYWILTLGRAASGIGQGLFLIGLQSYVLVVTPKARKSLGHAVKVIGRNSGLIAGTAIGALLYAYMDYRQLFMLASIISLGALAYLYFLVPASERVGAGGVKRQATRSDSAIKTMIRNILSVIRDMEFMKTLLAIGIVGKISIAGVVMFAVPLLLSQKGFATEDIGLALMLYYIFGMVTTHITTKNVDGPGVTRWVLSLSAVIGGVSSLLLGCIGVSHLLEGAGTPGINLLAAFAIGMNHMLAGFGWSNLDAYLILFFIILIGVSNGLLAAPVMTHIGNLKVAEKYGLKSVSATYVFLERFGHVVGPLTIGWLMTSNQGSTLAVSFFGIITIGFGLLFLFSTRPQASAILKSGAV